MGSKDNMTVLIVKFNAQNFGDGGGVQARRQLRNAAATAAQENRNQYNNNQGQHYHGLGQAHPQQGSGGS